MGTTKLDHALATLEHAADHAHLASFEKAEVSQALKAAISSALDECVAAASDLERFLAHAAAATADRAGHHALYEAAAKVGDMPMQLRDALRSVEAFADIGGTAVGAMRRAALELKVSFEGHSDAMVMAAVDKELARALARYDEALYAIAKTRSGFVDLVLEQRKALGHLQRDLTASVSGEPR